MDCSSDKMKIDTLSYKVFSDEEIVDRYPNSYIALKAHEATVIEFKSDMLEFRIETIGNDLHNFNDIEATIFATEKVCKYTLDTFRKCLHSLNYYGSSGDMLKYLNCYNSGDDMILYIHSVNTTTKELFRIMYMLLKIISECIEKEKETNIT